MTDEIELENLSKGPNEDEKVSLFDLMYTLRNSPLKCHFEFALNSSESNEIVMVCRHPSECILAIFVIH